MICQVGTYPNCSRSVLHSGSFNLALLLDLPHLPPPLIGGGAPVALLLAADWLGDKNHGFKYTAAFAFWLISSKQWGCQGPSTNQRQGGMWQKEQE